MPKKKQPANAFFFFMLDYKERCERNGEHFPNGLKDVQIEAGPEWDVMSMEQKKKYEIMAKNEKARLKADNSQKMTCLHTPFSAIDRRQEEEQEKRTEMNNFIENTIANLLRNGSLAEYKFYLIHINFFCISEGLCYHPAELAICEFSLGQGVTNVLNTIMDPGQIPLGYRFDAIQKSDTTHKIPIEDNGGEKQFFKVLMELNKFIQPGTKALGGQYPPLFTMPDNVNLNTSMSAVESVLETLCSCDPSEVSNVEKYRIYPIHKLFLELQNVCCRMKQDELSALPTLSVALMEFEKDVFNFTEEIACSFHQNVDAVQYCSKSYVQRWAYLICDYCCQYLNIEVVPGHHVPRRADTGYSKKMELLRLKELEEEKKEAKAPRSFTWRDSNVESERWVPKENPPLPRPTGRANLEAMLPPRADNDLDLSSFPSLDGACVLGRGKRHYQRGDRNSRGAGHGSSKMSFASAMKK